MSYLRFRSHFGGGVFPALLIRQEPGAYRRKSYWFSISQCQPYDTQRVKSASTHHPTYSINCESRSKRDAIAKKACQGHGAPVARHRRGRGELGATAAAHAGAGDGINVRSGARDGRPQLYPSFDGHCKLWQYFRPRWFGPRQLSVTFVPQAEHADLRLDFLLFGASNRRYGSLFPDNGIMVVDATSFQAMRSADKARARREEEERRRAEQLEKQKTARRAALLQLLDML